jgi:RNA polymerase sigma-70 factor (ECF subfamily)
VALNARRDGRNERCLEPAQVVDKRRTATQDLLREARLKEVRLAVAMLPAKQRAAMLMHKYEGMSYAQIAGALACSEKAVKSLLFREYETLRVRLAHLA